MVCALRRAINFALDELTLVLPHFLLHLNRDSIWRILRAEGLNRRPKPPADRPTKGHGIFRDDDLGFMHIDIKHLPKLLTSDRDRCNRYLFVAIDRRSQSVHLAFKDEQMERSAIAFLREAARAFPFLLTRVLIDNGSCFTPAFTKAGTELGLQYRHIRPRTLQTNVLVERFNGRISSKVLEINFYSHRAMEQLLRNFDAGYKARRQRVLDGSTPDQFVTERPKAESDLARAAPQGRTGLCDITKACLIADRARKSHKKTRRRLPRHRLHRVYTQARACRKPDEKCIRSL